MIANPSWAALEMHSDGVGRTDCFCSKWKYSSFVTTLHMLMTPSASLVLHADDNVGSLWVLLLGLFGAPVDVPTLGGRTTFVTTSCSVDSRQYTVAHGIMIYILATFGGVVALDVKSILLVCRVLAIGILIGADARVGTELSAAAVARNGRDEGATR